MIVRRCALARREREEGAALVELTLIGLILVLLLAGAFDLGMGWRAGLVVNEAARTGARIGSGQGSDQMADYSLLSGVRSALDSSGVLDQVERVVIFRSSGGAVPPSCKVGAPAAQPCNILTGDQLRTLSAAPAEAVDDAGCIINAMTRNWCPTARNSVQLTADYLGVWVLMRHDYMFPILGAGMDVQRTAVMRLEPEESTP